MILEYNLQFFAQEGSGGEKTEEATPKKIEESRKEGTVAKSKELVNAVGILTLFLLLKFGIRFYGVRLIEIFDKYWKMLDRNLLDEFDIMRALTLQNEISKDTLIITSPFLIVGFLVAFLVTKMQFTWKITAKPMQPKFSKINPISGFKRMFSSRALFELIKAVAQILLIGYVAYSVLQSHANDLYLLYGMTIPEALSLMMDIIWTLGIRISMVMLAIGIIDYIYQRYKYKKDLKMTKQEVKDEFKNSEGDPQIKGQQKQKMRQASQRRMMASVPEADVIITNPTHFAVALKYDSEKNSAPVVVAKGTDFLANKIKETAREHGVEIVENKAVARMLYYNVDVDKEIPPELYKAVADILAYVYSLKKAG